METRTGIGIYLVTARNRSRARKITRFSVENRFTNQADELSLKMNEGCAPLLIDQPLVSVQRVLRKAAPDGPTDPDGDETVGASDLAILLGNWG